VIAQLREELHAEYIILSGYGEFELAQRAISLGVCAYLLKPLDEQLLHEVGKKFSRIITIEDGVRNGGMGSAVLEWMNDHGYSPVITRMGLPDEFIEHGTVEELQKICHIDQNSIIAAIKETKK